MLIPRPQGHFLSGVDNCCYLWSGVVTASYPSNPVHKSLSLTANDYS